MKRGINRTRDDDTDIVVAAKIEVLVVMEGGAVTEVAVDPEDVLLLVRTQMFPKNNGHTMLS
jgi:hypothetical protein